MFPYAVVFVETDITVVKSIPQYPKTAICMLHITGLNRKLGAKSERIFFQNEVWVNSHLLVDST